MENSKISWTHHTFNAWWGCEHADAEPGSEDKSPECDHCYAETTDKRYGGDHWGAGAPPRFFGDAYWRKPLSWNRDAERDGVRARVFCSSMADVFQLHSEHVTRASMEAERDRLWALIQATPHLDWLLLTKRPENFATMLPWSPGQTVTKRWEHPWLNVWLGVTAGVERSMWRVRVLRETPAARRFISCEPLLEHISADAWDDALRGGYYANPSEHTIDWLIVGDESGPHKRPTQPDWVRTAREAAARHRVAFHFKQWAGKDVGGITGIRKGPNGKIHLPMLDGKQHAAFPGK